MSVDPRLAEAARQMLVELEAGGTASFEQYRDDPIGFFRDVLGIEPWEGEGGAGQADLLRAVVDHDRIACRSGHKISKSNSAAGLALWWVATRTGARAILTAPTFNQVRSILWRELRSMDRRSGIASKLGGELPLDPRTGLQLPNGNEIRGVSTSAPENLAGISGAALLFIIDEGTGFPDELFEVVRGNSAGGAKIFCISNPTRTTGWFFSLFRKKGKRWKLFAISSESTPNARSGKTLIPGLATRDYIEEMREECAPDWENHPVYLVRVRGEFPPQGADVVIGLRDVERAVARWKPETPFDVDLVLGVDVARFGDDASVIQPVRGNHAYEPREFMHVDGPELAQEVVRCVQGLRLSEAEKVRVNVDGIGIGATAVDALKHHEQVLQGRIAVVDMNVGEKADDEHHRNLRSQLWFGCADWLKGGGTMPEHDRRDAELLAAMYGFTARGEKEVESKKIMRKTLGRSPDFADALCLAVYRGARGAWWGYSYEGASDPRHPAPPTESDGWDDDEGSGGRYL